MEAKCRRTIAPVAQRLPTMIGTPPSLRNMTWSVLRARRRARASVLERSVHRCTCAQAFVFLGGSDLDILRRPEFCNDHVDGHQLGISALHRARCARNAKAQVRLAKMRVKPVEVRSGVKV